MNGSLADSEDNKEVAEQVKVLAVSSFSNLKGLASEKF